MKRKFLGIILVLSITSILSACTNKVEVVDKLQTEDQKETRTDTEAEELRNKENKELDGKENEKTEENTGETEDAQLTIFYGDSDSVNILSKSISVKEISPEEIIKQLGIVGIVPETLKINSFELSEGNIKIDFSSDFTDMLRQQGTAGEYIMMGSVVNTFLAAYDAESIFITVEGETLESGHNVYDGKLKFYDSKDEVE